jgi:hypothetical protein
MNPDPVEGVISLDTDVCVPECPAISSVIKEDYPFEIVFL